MTFSENSLPLVSVANLKSKHVGPAGPLPLHYDVPAGQALSIGPYRLPQTYIKAVKEGARD